MKKLVKDKQIRKLTWLYFCEQKFIEVVLVLFALVFLTFAPHYLGHNIGDNRSDWCDHDGQNQRITECNNVERAFLTCELALSWISRSFAILSLDRHRTECSLLRHNADKQEKARQTYCHY